MSTIFKTGINIPKVVKKLELKNYHGDLKGQFIMVWVNLSRSVHNEYADMQTKIHTWNEEGKQLLLDLQAQVKEAQEAKKSKKKIEQVRKKNQKVYDDHMESITVINEEMYTWYANVFSQHKDASHHCTSEQVKELADASAEQDNANFWGWLTHQTHAMIIAHGNQHLKK